MPVANPMATNRQVSALHAALGQVILEALADETVLEVMANPDGTVWIDRFGCDREQVGQISKGKAESVIRLVADYIGETVGTHNPDIAGTLMETGERFQGLVPPLVTAPSFVIRKRPPVIYYLSDYVSDGILTQSHAMTLRRAVEEKQNILVVGGTRSGKTTLANAILAEPSFRKSRVILIEDTPELQCSALCKVEVLTKRTKPVRDMTDILRLTMRYGPDRIVIGEVRGGEALAMLKAWNTGHPGGICTCHANSAEEALERIEDLVGEVVQNIPYQSIARAIDLVVFIERDRDGLQVKEISQVLGYKDGEYQMRQV